MSVALSCIHSSGKAFIMDDVERIAVNLGSLNKLGTLSTSG